MGRVILNVHLLLVGAGDLMILNVLLVQTSFLTNSVCLIVMTLIHMECKSITLSKLCYYGNIIS